jgi:hypothetical protein
MKVKHLVYVPLILEKAGWKSELRVLAGSRNRFLSYPDTDKSSITRLGILPEPVMIHDKVSFSCIL